MSYYIPLPDGSFVEVPDNIPQEQAERQIALDPRYRPIIEQSFDRQKKAIPDAYGYLMRGVGQIPTAAGSIINVVPGMEDNIVGRGLRNVGQAISDYGTSQLSEGTRKQQALFDLAMQEAESKGLGEQAKTALAEAIRNPRIVAGVAIESLPSLATALVGGLAVRGAAGVASRVAGRQLAQTTATRAGVAGAVGTESLLEGGGSADEVYRTITALSPEQLQRSPEYQELLKQGLNPDEAKERLAVSAARQAAAQTAAISGTVGAALPGAEGAMFRPMTSRGVVGRALGTSLSELGQEAGQEGGAALSENIARQRAEVDRELLAGVGSRATMGAIVGAGVGAGVGAIRPGPGPEIDRTENEELRNILNEYVNVRGEAPVAPPAISERDAEAAAFVAANLPVSEEMFLAMPPAGRTRVLAIARNRADRVAASEQEQGFRQEAETRAAEQAEQAASFVVANLPITREQFLSMSQPVRSRVLDIAKRRIENAAIVQQERADAEATAELTQVFRQQAEDRARAEQVRLAEEAEALRIQNIADQQAQAQEETAALSRAAQQTISPGAPQTSQQELSQAIQESRGTRGPVGDATTARYIEARAMEAPNQPISIPAFQQHFRAQGLPVPTLQQAKDTLDKYAEDANARFVKPRFTLNVENGRYVPVDNDLQAPPTAPLPKAEPIIPPEIERPLTDLRKGLRKPRNKNAEDQASYQARRDAADQLEAELFSRDLTPQSSDEEIAQAFGYVGGQPREEYSSRKPRGPIGGTAPMQVSIPERFAAEAKPAATPEDQAAQQEASDKAQANEARRAEILQKLNDEYLAKLEAKGSQGKRAADAVRKNLNDRTLSAEQLYGAFKGAEIIAKTLPANANHEIEFVKYLTDAAGKEVQGKRIEVKDSSSAGIIKLSLAENQLPLLSETASHEAFHVLQDYYGKYDPDFRKLMKQSFRDGMTINDVDSTIKRKLQTIRMPNGEQSYWDILVQSLPNEKLSAREAEAYVFGSLAEAARRGVPMTGMKPAFTRFVNFLTKFFRRMGNSLRGDGFNSPDDVFGRVVEGDAGRFAGEAAPEFRGSEEFSARLSTTIEVDGVQRPTTNSEGRSIHPTEEGVRNFWRWFGDSKVVDENGKPLVVYHGTSKDVDFQSFKMKPRGIWFADNPKEASNYAIENDSMGSSYDYAGRISPKNVASRVIPSYLSIQNAIEPTQQEMDRLLGKTGEANYARVQGEVFNGMKSRGADGVNMGGGVWVAINSPSQIKSAVGNVGEFSGKNPKIQYSARLPPGSATYQAAAKKINGERMKQNSVFKRGIDALVGSRAEYTYVYSGKKEAVKPKTNLAINVANQFHGFHLFDQLMERKGRMDLAGVGRALESAMNNDGRMQTMIEGGGIGLNPVTKMVERNKNVKALADIVFGKIKADEADASQRYFVARRERDERARGRVGFANLTDSEINEIIKYSETNRPEWKEVAKDLNDWNKGLVKILVDSGVLDKKTGDELSSVFYTPFYRVLEDDFQSSADSVIGPKAAASLKNPSDALKKLSGEGTDPVGDLFENIIRNADGIVKAALKNVAMQKAVASMEFAGIAEKVKTKLPGAKNIVTIRDNGKDVFYRVDDPLLMTALATMPQSMQHGIFKAMAKVGGFTRDMITHTPAFTIASLIRGKEMSYGQDGVSLARSTVLAFGRALKANFSEAEKKKGDLPINKIRDITGFGGMSFGMGSPDVSAEFKRMLRRASKQETTFDSTKRLLGWYALKRVGESAEMAERIKVYEHHKAKGASDEDAAWEAYAMAPFSRRGAGNGFLGTVVTTLAPIVPFLNARIQGNFRLLEKGIHNPFGMRLIDRKLGPDKVARGMWLRGMVLMGFSMAMAMLASDDEQWDNENPETKFMYHIAYLGSGPDAPRILIPRGFELGTLFGAIPVFMYDAIRKDGGNDLGKLFGLTLQSTFGINPPAALAPVLEVVTNYDFFRGRELESAGMESRPKSERFNAETSEAAKVVADAVNSSLGNLPRGMRVEMSPIQAQHLIKGYLGGVGVWSMQVVDTVLGASGAVPQKPDGFFGDPVSPAALAATALQVNRFVRGKEDMVSRSVGEFYDIKREVTQWTTALNDAQIQRNIERVKEIQEERQSTLAMRSVVNKAGPAISELSRMIDALRKSPELGDAEERRRRILELIRQRNQIADRVLEAAREQGVR